MSETDSEIVPVLEPDSAKLSFEQFVRQRSAIEDPVETKPAGTFFERLTKDQEWHGREERNQVRRCRELTAVVFGNLRDVTLYRAGRIQIEIFILGRDAEMNIAGIRTRAVET